MRYAFLFISFICISLQTVQAQVYTSRLDKEIILIGPENVSHKNPNIAQRYIINLENRVDDLNHLIAENNRTLEALDVISLNKKLNKKEKRTYSKTLKSNSNINNEIAITTEFLQMWIDVQRVERLEDEFYALTKNAKGDYLITTSQGTLTPNEYRIVLSGNPSRYKEIIPVQYNEAKVEWVKEKSAKKITSGTTCCSSDSGESYAMNKKITEASCTFKQYSGAPYNNETCPLGFEYSATDLACTRVLELPTDNSNQSIQIVQVANEENLELLSWEKVEDKTLISSKN